MQEAAGAQSAAAIHLLGLRKPDGAAEVLLNYLPGADAERANEVRAALFAIAQAECEPDTALIAGAERQGFGAASGRCRRPRQGRRRLCSSSQAGGSSRPAQDRQERQEWIDGKLDLETKRSSDYQFFNAFEDKVFAKP